MSTAMTPGIIGQTNSYYGRFGRFIGLFGTNVQVIKINITLLHYHLARHLSKDGGPPLQESNPNIQVYNSFIKNIYICTLHYDVGRTNIT
jgi:hypothetical protein